MKLILISVLLFLSWISAYSQEENNNSSWDNELWAGTRFSWGENKFKYNGEFIATATDAASAMATDMFQKDKSIDKVIIDYPMGPTGSGSVTASISRSKTFKIPGTDKSACVAKVNGAVAPAVIVPPKFSTTGVPPSIVY